MRPSARLCPCSAPLRRWWGVGALVPSRALLVPLRGGGGGGALPSPPLPRATAGAGAGAGAGAVGGAATGAATGALPRATGWRRRWGWRCPPLPSPWGGGEWAQKTPPWGGGGCAQKTPTVGWGLLLFTFFEDPDYSDHIRYEERSL